VAAVAAGGSVGYNTRPLGLKKQQDLIVAAKSKVAPKNVAKASKPAAKGRATAKPAAKKGPVKTIASALAKLVKPAAKPAAKKPVAKAAKPTKPAAKPAAKPVAKAVKPAPKAAAKPAAKPVAKPAAKAAAKPVAAAKPAVPAKTAAKTHNAPTPAAPVAPATAKPAAAKAAPVKGGGKDSTQNARTAMPAVTPERAPSRPSDNGLKARAVKPSKPVTSNDVPPLALPGVKVELPEGYRPASGDGEYMSPLHLEYFRRKLLNWRAELVEESKQTIDNLREEVRDVGDEAERATRETENSLELRTRDRYRKLIGKIDKALKRIEDGAYGYCEETGEEIGIERLEARPIATLCLDAQERWEHRQKLMGD
jgi:DnaK suppressor protein